MNDSEPVRRFSSTPLHLRLVAFPITCFVGALLTDIGYSQSADIQWANFSAWLLAAGMLLGAVAGAAGIYDLIANRRLRAQALVWPYVGATAAVLLFALFNNFVHSRDGWTSVVPAGLTLSVLTLVAILVTFGLGLVLFRGFEREVAR